MFAIPDAPKAGLLDTQVSLCVVTTLLSWPPKPRVLRLKCGTSNETASQSPQRPISFSAAFYIPFAQPEAPPSNCYKWPNWANLILMEGSGWQRRTAFPCSSPSARSSSSAEASLARPSPSRSLCVSFDALSEEEARFEKTQPDLPNSAAHSATSMPPPSRTSLSSERMANRNETTVNALSFRND